MNHKLLVLFWAGIVAISLITLGLRPNIHLETSFLELLPQSFDQQESLEHLHEFDQQMSKRVLYLIHHPDSSKAISSLGQLRSNIETSNLFQPLPPLMDESRGKKLFDSFFDKRYFLPNPQINSALQHDLLTSQKQTIYSGFSPMIAFEKDPLLVFQSLLESWTLNQGDLFVEEGYLALEVDEKTYYLLNAETFESPFSRDASQKAVQLLTHIEKELITKHPELEIHHTGVLFFSQRESSKIEKEITFISTLSFAIVSFLIWLVFASLKPMLHTILAIISGLLTAFITTLACFGEIHLVTLGFGATLIGISVDYAFHYLVGHQSDRQVDLKLFRSIFLGLLTSVLSFSVFAIAPIVVLKQMAIFIILGLSASFSYVYICFPYVSFKHLQHPRFHSICDNFCLALHKLYPFRKPSTILGFAMLISCSLWLSTNFNFNDDLRSLGNPEAQMLEKDQWIRKLRGELDPNRSIIVQAKSLEELLQKEELLQTKLNQLPLQSQQSRKVISLSQSLPSVKKQQQLQKDWIEWFHTHESEYKAYLNEFGFETNFYDRELKEIKESSFLSFQDWSTSPLAEASKHLLIQKKDAFYSLFLIGGFDVDHLRKFCEDIDGVNYIDRVETYSNSLHYFRHLTLKWLGVIYCLIAVACLCLLKPQKALRLLLAPSLGVCLSIFVLNLNLDDGLNLFHLIASLLVWGIGMDYAILMQQHSQHEPKVLLANACSALTTICSFGFLAISESPVLSAFGSTILIGVMISFITSSLIFATPQPLKATAP